jgi:nitrite reductase (NADH) small subunit
MARTALAFAIAPTVRAIDMGLLRDLPVARSRVVHVGGGRRVALHRTRRGAVYATDPTCACHDASLDGALIGGRIVVCPSHSYAFDLSTGQCVGEAAGALRTYPTRLSADGRVFVELDDDHGPVL